MARNYALLAWLTTASGRQLRQNGQERRSDPAGEEQAEVTIA